MANFKRRHRRRAGIKGCCGMCMLRKTDGRRNHRRLTQQELAGECTQQMEYEDPFKMINDILDYVAKHPRQVIVCDDRITELLIGFTLRVEDPSLLTRPYWCIKFNNYKASLNRLDIPARARDYLSEVFRTQLSRSFLAKFLTRGRKPPEFEGAI